jgi:ketosteroid isomerase-like protein
MDLRQVIEEFRSAADEFSKGDPEPVKRLYSHRDDVVLANPFGPAVRGWKKVSEALDSAAARFRDGKKTVFEPVSEYVTSDLATFHEIERWTSRVSGREEHATFVLRVTTTYRREGGDWRIVHRHADPITTFHSDGPLRPAGN